MPWADTGGLACEALGMSERSRGGACRAGWTGRGHCVWRPRLEGYYDRRYERRQVVSKQARSCSYLPFHSTSTNTRIVLCALDLPSPTPTRCDLPIVVSCSTRRNEADQSDQAGSHPHSSRRANIICRETAPATLPPLEPPCLDSASSSLVLSRHVARHTPTSSAPAPAPAPALLSPSTHHPSSLACPLRHRHALSLFPRYFVQLPALRAVCLSQAATALRPLLSTPPSSPSIPVPWSDHPHHHLLDIHSPPLPRLCYQLLLIHLQLPIRLPFRLPRIFSCHLAHPPSHRRGPVPPPYTSDARGKTVVPPQSPCTVAIRSRASQPTQMPVLHVQPQRILFPRGQAGAVGENHPERYQEV
jgi:hypothetical protein